MMNANEAATASQKMSAQADTFRRLVQRFPFGSPERYARVIVWQEARHEATDACVKARFEQAGISDAIGEAAIDELIDAGLVLPTVIDGRARCGLDFDFGLLAALRTA